MHMRICIYIYRCVYMYTHTHLRCSGTRVLALSTRVLSTRVFSTRVLSTRVLSTHSNAFSRCASW